MDETIFIFYNKWIDISTKLELFRYLIICLIEKHSNTWDTDLGKLIHLTDPECIILSNMLHPGLSHKKHEGTAAIDSFDVSLDRNNSFTKPTGQSS